MKRLVSILLMLAMVFTLAACGPGAKEEEKQYTEWKEMYSTELTTFDYVSTTASAVNGLAQLTQANLICCDEYGLVRPELSTGWHLSDDALTYTFYIEPGNMWYDYQLNAVEEVTAEDWVTAAKHILNPDEVAGATTNQLCNTIAGAKAYWEDNSIGFDKVGVKAVDKYTLEFTLTQPCAYFLTWLSRNTWLGVPTKWFAEHKADFGVSNETILYCGPYAITSYEPEYERTLTAIPGFKDYDKITIGTMSYRFNLEAGTNGPELYLRGDVSYSELVTDVYNEWMKDPEKAKLVQPKGYGFIPFWFGFNFDPTFDAKFEPDNWKIAVNNVNFRKSLMYAINKFAYNQTMDPVRYEERTLNTIVYDDYVIVDGKDYIHTNGLEEYTELPSGQTYDPAKAKEYAEKAKAELTQKGCKFPVKIVIPYDTATAGLDARLNLLAQQYKDTFGPDYVEVILDPYAGNGFNSDIRNAGKWAMCEVRWGPDFIDPLDSYYGMLKMTGADAYGKMYLAEEYYDEALGYGTFEKMCIEANAEYNDLNKRYSLFAQAEKFMLDEALVIPIYRQGGGWMVNNKQPFTGNCTMYGSQSHLMKFGIVNETSVGTEEYYQIWDAYQKEVAAARAKYPEESKAYEK